MHETMIIMGGSFNPPTAAHQRLLLAAVESLQADRGIFVPAPHRYVLNKLKKSRCPEDLLPERVRLAMLCAMAEDDPRLSVDDLEFRREGKSYTYDTMLALQEKYPKAELYFFAGGDKVRILPRWYRIREFLEHFHIILVARDGEDPETELAENPFLCQYRDRFHIMRAPEGVEGVSSSAIRSLLRSGLPGAEAMCHPRVWTLLNEFGSMGKRRVECFRNEYRFLSNFWPAPVTYRGLTYQSSEAAFQAQKCLTEEEKLQFVHLPTNMAKRLGRTVQLRPDWEEVKRDIMEEIVRAKFNQNADLKSQLLATGDMLLEEGNTWHDTYWGVDVRTREGENHLGRILMRVRQELQEEESAGTE